MAYIGFYGCAGRLVKVVSFKQGQRRKANTSQYRSPKAVHRIACPACGIEHTINVWWREPRPGETKQAEVKL